MEDATSDKVIAGHNGRRMRRVAPCVFVLSQMLMSYHCWCVRLVMGIGILLLPLSLVQAQTTTFTLTVTKAGTGIGTVTSSPSGINCGTTCSASFASGTSTSLIATANSGSTFSGWSGACTGTASCTVIMNANKSVTATFTVIPLIASISPLSGPIGTVVTVSGSRFGAKKGTSTVTFNGVVATPTSWSNTKIVTPVPASATTGSVVVKVGGISSNGVVFTVIPSPIIGSISPLSGPIGTVVTVSGSGFGVTQGTSTVTFNGAVAVPNSWSNATIVTPVPVSATTGSVVVKAGGISSNGVAFTVIPSPIISSISPLSGPIGTVVTVSGSGFGVKQGTSTVTFNGMVATPTSWSNTKVVTPVPFGAITGSVVVKVGGISSNGVVFTVTGPDLVMTAVSTTATRVGTGGTLTITDTVKNQGTVAIIASWLYVGFYLSTDATITTADTIIGERNIGGLAAGATSSGTAIVTVPATLTAGTYYLGAIADS